MLKAAHPSNKRVKRVKGVTGEQRGRAFSPFTLLALFTLLTLSPSVFSAEAETLKKNQTGLYRDVFDQGMYYEMTNYLRFDRLGRKLTGKKKRAADVNAFDEIPDSGFFTNRQGRKPLSADELVNGPKGDALDVSGNITITEGKAEGLHPGFFVKDSKGNQFLLKFDSPDYLELNTGAETTASRFYHAIGYNVPSYNVAVFSPERLVPGEGATIIDSTGFEKKLTKEKLEEFLLFIPWDSEGRFRASATQVLPGQNLGNFFFYGRRKKDPDDKLDHDTLREIRALRLFSAWLNNFDTRESNTLDLLVEENGRKFVKHYLIDFNGALGAAYEGPKPPMLGHEYMIDNGETTKAIFALGLWEKPWQKRWREAGSEYNTPAAVGYFDNHYFNPEGYKTQMPHYAFRDLTLADALWAAKIIMSFSDEEIRSMMKAGKYSNSEDGEAIAKVLIERRDLMGRYWFKKTNALSGFDISGSKLVFEDLSVKHGFEKENTALYRAQVFAREGKNFKKITQLESREPSFNLEQGWLSKEIRLDIRTVRNDAKPSPVMRVTLNGGKMAGIAHED